MDDGDTDRDDALRPRRRAADRRLARRDPDPRPRREPQGHEPDRGELLRAVRLRRPHLRPPRPRRVGRLRHVRRRPRDRRPARARAAVRRAARRRRPADRRAGASRTAPARRGSAAAQGVPFKAIDVWQTWTDLFTSLYPNGVAEVGRHRRPAERDPGRQALARPLLAAGRRAHGHEPATSCRTFAAQRSVLPRSPQADDADAHPPGPPRLRLRQRAGDHGLPAAERPEAPLLRRPRARPVDLPRRRTPTTR